MISENFKKRFLTSLILLLLVIIIFTFKPILVLVLIVIGNFAIIEFFKIIQKICKNKLKQLFFNIMFIIYLFTFCTFFFIFSNFLQLKILLFTFLVCCVASDLGGYFFGKFLKGPKLSKISPNKTIAGSLGSILLSCISIQTILIFYNISLNFKILLLGLSISIACQIGDIFFSFLKRKANLKDTENYLPGHGGFLDRIDGILLGIPVGFLFLKILL